MLKHFLPAAAVFSCLCACSHSHTVTTSDGSATVTLDNGKDGGGSVRAVGKDGSTVDINTGKAITGYPSDIPLYAGKPAMDVNNAEKHGRALILQTPDSMDKIKAFYKSGLDSNGWKVVTTVNTDKMVMYSATKDNRQLVIQVAGDGQQRSISQTYSDKQ